MANLRTKRKHAETLCGKLGELWKCTFKLKKTYTQATRVARPGVAPHTVVLHGGTWMCSSCGMCFKKRNKNGCVVGGSRDRACTGRCRIREEMHISHEVHTARTELGTLITFCSACGANGSEKVVLLKER